MAQELDQMCFDNLDEFVNDENKLVTYKWLSRTLSMHVNQAKLALFRFVEQQRNKKDNDGLSVMYFLSGLVNDQDTMVYKAQVVSEDRLDSTKSTYSVLTSCHLYSVQKGKHQDVNSLYMADYDLLKENILNTNQFSAVSCVAAKLRSEEEIQKMSNTKVPDQKAAQPNDIITKPAAKPAIPQKSAKDKKPVGIAGMFAKAGNKVTDGKKDDKTAAKNDSSKSEEKVQDKTSKEKAKEKKGGVMNFFAKQAAKPKLESTGNDSQEKESTEEVAVPQKTEPSKKKSPQKNDTLPKDCSKTEKKDTKKGRKKKVESDDEDPVPQQKKRRRIKQQMIDSSSSEEEMEIESPIPSPPPPESDPEEIPPTPSPEPRRRKHSPSPSKSSPTASPVLQKQADDNEMCGRIRKRKLVSKTFVNDEGFMVTEKVYEDEWVDASESKESVPKATNTDKKTTAKPKKSPPAKRPSPSKQSGKQTSLMSFFKKK